jgi:hypothetical protein
VNIKYLIQKLVNGEWVNQESMGSFSSEIEANEMIYISIKNKSEFWTDYKVIQYV